MTSVQYQIPNGKNGPVSVGKLGYGLMNFTWRPNQVSDEVAFKAILTALESGSTFLNSGEFYGMPNHYCAGIELLGRFFDQYPEWSEPVLSVKGGLDWSEGQLKPDGSAEFLFNSVTNINMKLGKKKMDLFEMARVDQSRPIEEVAKNISKLIHDGHFTHFGLSEVSTSTLRKAHAIHPVSAVEAEYSMWALDPEQDGLLKACQELNIPLVAYSPLGRGMLTGSIRSPKDIPEGDMRHHFDRFKPENFDQNLKIVDAIAELAKKKGVTNTQLALAWLCSIDNVIPIPGSTRVQGVEEAVAAMKVTLSEEEKVEIRKLVDGANVVGGRYNAHMEKSLAV